MKQHYFLTVQALFLSGNGFIIGNVVETAKKAAVWIRDFTYIPIDVKYIKASEDEKSWWESLMPFHESTLDPGQEFDAFQIMFDEYWGLGLLGGQHYEIIAPMIETKLKMRMYHADRVNSWWEEATYGTSRLIMGLPNKWKVTRASGRHQRINKEYEELRKNWNHEDLLVLKPEVEQSSNTMLTLEVSHHLFKAWVRVVFTNEKVNQDLEQNVVQRWFNIAQSAKGDDVYDEMKKNTKSPAAKIVYSVETLNRFTRSEYKCVMTQYHKKSRDTANEPFLSSIAQVDGPNWPKHLVVNYEGFQPDQEELFGCIAKLEETNMESLRKFVATKEASTETLKEREQKGQKA